jgi:catechol 2,3-dioxygenase-like lactoylglutathione lyase family enzyme
MPETENAGSPATPPVTRGAHHVGLTVPDLAQARAFFLDTLGFTQVGEKPDYPAAFVSDGVLMITLWQAADPQSALPFDRKNVIGLHHLALQVENGAALDALHGKLAAAPGVAIEFAPEPLGGSAIRHMMCTIPGGIRMEFIAPQG